MKKIKVLLILVVISLMLISYITMTKHPLIGEWISKRGQGVGFFHDPNAPYSLIFTEHKMHILDKAIDITYNLKTDRKDMLYVVDEKSGGKLEIILLDDGKIQLYFPGIGLRQYQRQSQWNFFNRE
jgi:hypothetical protein